MYSVVQLPELIINGCKFSFGSGFIYGDTEIAAKQGCEALKNLNKVSPLAGEFIQETLIKEGMSGRLIICFSHNSAPILSGDAYWQLNPSIHQQPLSLMSRILRKQYIKFMQDETNKFIGAAIVIGMNQKSLFELTSILAHEGAHAATYAATKSTDFSLSSSMYHNLYHSYWLDAQSYNKIEAISKFDVSSAEYKLFTRPRIYFNDKFSKSLAQFEIINNINTIPPDILDKTLKEAERLYYSGYPERLILENLAKYDKRLPIAFVQDSIIKAEKIRMAEIFTHFTEAELSSPGRVYTIAPKTCQQLESIFGKDLFSRPTSNHYLLGYKESKIKINKDAFLNLVKAHPRLVNAMQKAMSWSSQASFIAAIPLEVYLDQKFSKDKLLSDSTTEVATKTLLSTIIFRALGGSSGLALSVLSTLAEMSPDLKKLHAEACQEFKAVPKQGDIIAFKQYLDNFYTVNPFAHPETLYASYFQRFLRQFSTNYIYHNVIETDANTVNYVVRGLTNSIDTNPPEYFSSMTSAEQAEWALQLREQAATYLQKHPQKKIKYIQQAEQLRPYDSCYQLAHTQIVNNLLINKALEQQQETCPVKQPEVTSTSLTGEMEVTHHVTCLKHPNPFGNITPSISISDNTIQVGAVSVGNITGLNIAISIQLPDISEWVTEKVNLLIGYCVKTGSIDFCGHTYTYKIYTSGSGLSERLSGRFYKIEMKDKNTGEQTTVYVALKSADLTKKKNKKILSEKFNEGILCLIQKYLPQEIHNLNNQILECIQNNNFSQASTLAVNFRNQYGEISELYYQADNIIQSVAATKQEYLEQQAQINQLSEIWVNSTKEILSILESESYEMVLDKIINVKEKFQENDDCMAWLASIEQLAQDAITVTANLSKMAESFEQGDFETAMQIAKYLSEQEYIDAQVAEKYINACTDNIHLLNTIEEAYEKQTTLCAALDLIFDCVEATFNQKKLCSEKIIRSIRFCAIATRAFPWLTTLVLDLPTASFSRKITPYGLLYRSQIQACINTGLHPFQSLSNLQSSWHVLHCLVELGNIASNDHFIDERYLEYSNWGLFTLQGISLYQLHKQGADVSASVKLYALEPAVQLSAYCIEQLWPQVKFYPAYYLTKDTISAIIALYIKHTNSNISDLVSLKSLFHLYMAGDKWISNNYHFRAYGALINGYYAEIRLKNNSRADDILSILREYMIAYHSGIEYNDTDPEVVQHIKCLLFDDAISKKFERKQYEEIIEATIRLKYSYVGLDRKIEAGYPVKFILNSMLLRMQSHFLQKKPDLYAFEADYNYLYQEHLLTSPALEKQLKPIFIKIAHEVRELAASTAHHFLQYKIDIFIPGQCRRFLEFKLEGLDSPSENITCPIEKKRWFRYQGLSAEAKTHLASYFHLNCEYSDALASIDAIPVNERSLFSWYTLYLILVDTRNKCNTSSSLAKMTYSLLLTTGIILASIRNYNDTKNKNLIGYLSALESQLDIEYINYTRLMYRFSNNGVHVDMVYQDEPLEYFKKIKLESSVQHCLNQRAEELSYIELIKNTCCSFLQATNQMLLGSVKDIAINDSRLWMLSQYKNYLHHTSQKIEEVNPVEPSAIPSELSIRKNIYPPKIS